MNPRLTPLLLPLLPALAAVPGALLAQTPEPAVRLEPGAESGRYQFRIEDRSNSSWRIESTTDLSTWSDRGSFRIHNTSHSLDIQAASAPIFFRIISLDTQLGASLADATTLPSAALTYSVLNLPPHLTTPQINGQDTTPANNAVSDNGATLGRVLFYDKRLSANNTVSCASCHQAAHGFSDPARFSTGFEGGLTDRNSMGLTSARYYPRRSFFWDERAATLEDQVLQPIQNTVEMGLTLDEAVAKVSAQPYYVELFTKAFGTATVTADRISRALAQFVRSIVSSSTKYDQGVATGFTNFTPQENRGRQIFTGPAGGCAACHGTDNFVPGGLFNNGVDLVSVDLGVGGVNGNPADVGKFKVPSLRNIELTAPYMHDGRFATLEEVVEFYNSGVNAHPNLSPQMRIPPGQPGAGQPRRLNLSTADKTALVAFLRTLTDTTVTTDPKFQDPFRQNGTVVVP